MVDVHFCIDSEENFKKEPLKRPEENCLIGEGRLKKKKSITDYEGEPVSREL